MTDKLYLTDSYLKEMDAKITDIAGNELKLSRTVFFPTGGGQLCDTGVLTINGRQYNVVETKKAGDEVAHVLSQEPAAAIGDSVHGAIDWKKRYAYMRYHTASHVIDGITSNRYNGRLTGGIIYEDRAHDDFDMPALTRELALKILQEAQQIIDEGHNIKVKFLTKEEALKLPNLVRTEPGQDFFRGLDTIRVVEIEGFDQQFDGGTHVANTREVGRLELSKFENKGVHRKRIEMVLK